MIIPLIMSIPVVQPARLPTEGGFKEELPGKGSVPSAGRIRQVASPISMHDDHGCM